VVHQCEYFEIWKGGFGTRCVLVGHLDRRKASGSGKGVGKSRKFVLEVGLDRQSRRPW